MRRKDSRPAGRFLDGFLARRMNGHVGGIEQHDAENDGDVAQRQMHGQKRAADRANGRGDFKEHADADIGIPFAHVGGSRAGGSGDDGNERSADGVADVNVKDQGEQRDDDNAAAESGEGAEKAGRDGTGENENGQLKSAHA